MTEQKSSFLLVCSIKLMPMTKRLPGMTVKVRKEDKPGCYATAGEAEENVTSSKKIVGMGMKEVLGRGEAKFGTLHKDHGLNF